MMSSCCVLLDAMGIQRHVFETNNLRIIVGASLSLSRWQKACMDKWPKNVINSAGGNVLATFDDEKEAAAFRTEATEHMAPPGLEIAWAQVDAKKSDFSTWSALQVEISRYKCGDSGISYPHISSTGKTGCLHCGIRPADGLSPVKNKRTCSVCRSCYNASDILNYSQQGNSAIEKLYQAAAVAGFTDTFPDELSDLVKDDEDENDMLAVVVIDLNNLGNKVKETVMKQGFLGLRKFSNVIDSSISKVWSGLIIELAKQHRTAVGGRFFKMRPLLMGGDDMVVALPARFWPQAVQFVLKKLSERGLHACAGIAVAKHNFPINRMVQMAEELVTSAKGFARYSRTDESPEVSAIDWHIHQEAAFTSPLSARRNRYIREIGQTIECATRRPYTLSHFETLVHDSSELAEGLSRRKLHLLYGSLREGTQSTRDTLVHVFLRDEVRGLKKYPRIWSFVESVSGEFPLWETSDLTIDKKSRKVHDTHVVDMLELVLTKGGVET